MRKRILISVVLLAVGLSLTAIMMIWFKQGQMETDVAVMYTAEESEHIEGVFVRTEQQIDISGGSSVVYIPSDGERASKNGLLARVYATARETETNRKVDELQAELNDLKQIAIHSGSNSATALSLQAIERQIDAKILKISDTSLGGDLKDIPEQRRELTKLLNKRLQFTKGADFSGRISQLEGQISTLKNGMGSYKAITAPASGYFYSYSDGLESLAPSQLKNLTPKKIEELKNSAKEAKYIDKSKLVTEYRWYFAFDMPADKSIRVASDKVFVRFSDISNDIISAEVDQLVKPQSGSGDNAVGVLTSVTNTSQLSEFRMQGAELIVKSYTGLKINSKAIRTAAVEGQEVQGAYVLKGTRLTFKQIHPLTTTGGYTVCENVQKSGWLSLYDEVVINGKDMYDGKIVR